MERYIRHEMEKKEKLEREKLERERAIAEFNAKGEEEEKKRLELDAVHKSHKGSIIVLNFRSVQGQRIEEMQRDLIKVLREKRSRIVDDPDEMAELQTEIDARLHTYGRLESLYTMFFLS
jgi:hypothetical protein